MLNKFSRTYILPLPFDTYHIYTTTATMAMATTTVANNTGSKTLRHRALVITLLRAPYVYCCKQDAFEHKRNLYLRLNTNTMLRHWALGRRYCEIFLYTQHICIYIYCIVPIRYVLRSDRYFIPGYMCRARAVHKCRYRCNRSATMASGPERLCVPDFSGFRKPHHHHPIVV